MVLAECACGFSCGTEAAFTKHLARFPGSALHGRVQKGTLGMPGAPAAAGGPYRPLFAPQPPRSRSGSPRPDVQQAMAGHAMPDLLRPQPSQWQRPVYSQDVGFSASPPYIGGQRPPAAQHLDPHMPPAARHSDSHARPGHFGGAPHPAASYSSTASAGFGAAYSSTASAGFGRAGAEAGRPGDGSGCGVEAPSARLQPPQPHRAMRALSSLSAEAIAGLRETGEELASLEAQAEEIVFQLDCQALTPGQARTELAQVEAKAKRLECERVDAVYTSELGSGKAEAKSEKKDQLARLEALFQRLEVLFGKIKALERAS